MINYSSIYDAIVKCKGKIATFVYDKESYIFTETILGDLKCDFDVQYYDINVKFEDLLENSVLVINFDRSIEYENFLQIIQEKNIITIVLREDIVTSNTDLYGSHPTAKLFESSIIFLIRKRKLKVLKSNVKDFIDSDPKVANIDKLIRSIKLKILNKK